MIEYAHLIDYHRTAFLDDVGLPAYAAVTVLDRYGGEHLALAELNAIDDESVVCDVNCTTVFHEQVGLMPPLWRHRVALAPLRCGRTTRAGRPCRAPVTQPNAACSWHRTAPTPHDRQAST